MYVSFERDARVALGLARRRAEESAAAQIDTGHLLGALYLTLGPVRARLAHRGVTAARLRDALARVPPETSAQGLPDLAQLPFSETLRRALARAERGEPRSAAGPWTAPPRPRVDCLALLRALGSVEGRAARALWSLGIDARQVGQGVPPLPTRPLPARPQPALPLPARPLPARPPCRRAPCRHALSRRSLSRRSLSRRRPCPPRRASEAPRRTPSRPGSSSRRSLAAA